MIKTSLRLSSGTSWTATSIADQGRIIWGLCYDEASQDFKTSTCCEIARVPRQLHKMMMDKQVRHLWLGENCLLRMGVCLSIWMKLGKLSPITICGKSVKDSLSHLQVYSLSIFHICRFIICLPSTSAGLWLVYLPHLPVYNLSTFHICRFIAYLSG